MKKTNYIKLTGALMILMALFSITFAAHAKHVHAHIVKPKSDTSEVLFKVEAPLAESFNLKIYDTLNVLAAEVIVNGGINVLPSLSDGKYTFELSDTIGDVVETGKFSLPAYKPKEPKPDKIEHVHAHVKGTYLNDTLVLHVHAALTENFVLTIFDTAGVAVNTVPVAGGDNILPALPLGSYTFNLKDSNDVVVETGKFKITPIHIHAHVKGTRLNDTLVLHVHAAITESFVLTVFDSAGVVVYTLPVAGGENILPALPLGSYTFNLKDSSDVVVESGKFKIKPEHVHAHVKGKYYGDTLSFHVHADTSESFTLTIYNEADSVLYTLPVNGGYNLLPSLAIGHYSFILIDEEGNQVETGKFEIKPKHVHAHVKGKYYSDTLSFHVHADTTELFTLTIYNEADSVLYTLPVKGGDNVLPSLAVGHYSFIMVDEDGNQVEQGKFSVKVRPVDTGIHPNPSEPGLGSVFVDAPFTDSFTLQIYDGSLVLLHSLTIPGGATLLPSIPSGIYYYKVINADGYAVSKGRILIN